MSELIELYKSTLQKVPAYQYVFCGNHRLWIS